ncbi:MAG: choloylglycine hydrolase [Oscillospiraceae bacterium]
MCTAACLWKKDLCFGRTLDYDFSYGDKVTITPRNYRFDFKEAGTLPSHYAMIGMAHIADNYPLYYDAVNEKGLAMAGLNFVGYAKYGTKTSGDIALAPHEFIQYVLSRCENLSQARETVENIRLMDIRFSEQLPTASLHWIIADKTGAITIESTERGMFVYDNPVGVMTNNPEFPQQMLNLSNYMGLSPKQPNNGFSKSLKLAEYSRGLGAIGLPGDWSSQSRFVRAAFVRENSVCGDTDTECISQLFHILGSVNIPRGACEVGEEKYHITRYTSACINGLYCFTTYTNRQITAVDMKRENLDGSELIAYEQVAEEQINILN